MKTKTDEELLDSYVELFSALENGRFATTDNGTEVKEDLSVIKKEILYRMYTATSYLE